MRRGFRVESQISIVFHGADVVCVAPKLTLHEATMGSLIRSSLVMLLAIGLAQTASAQDSTTAKTAPAATTMPSSAPGVLTGKERLGRKWMDEQRIDNCNVPIDKRGNKPRPSTCPHVPTG
jgi:hypothetical protein